MAYLVTDEGNILVTDEGNQLITDAEPGTRFPLMLMLRLRIHAAWLLFMLMPGF